MNDDEYLAHTHTLALGRDVPLLHQNHYQEPQLFHPLDPQHLVDDGHGHHHDHPDLKPIKTPDQPPPPGDIRISTMTATCHTNLKVDLGLICGHVALVNTEGEKSVEGILKTMYAGENRGSSRRDSKSSKKSGKVFYNQATLIIRVWKSTYNDEVNLKLFNNGNIQMTGLKSQDDGYKAVNILYNSIKDIVVDDKHAVEVVQPQHQTELEEFAISKFDIVLINSDYSAEFLIKREKLHALLIQEYDIVSSYEPCTYPGVNSKYYWNKDYMDRSKYKPGVCYCSKPCNGKGVGDGDGCCKKVTIAIFQSGKLIITGAKTYQQITDAYDFINTVFKKNYSEVKREIPAFLLEEEKAKTKTKTKVQQPKVEEELSKQSGKLQPPKNAEIRWITPQ